MADDAIPVAAVGSSTAIIPLGNKPYASPFYSLGRERCENLYLEIAQSTNSKAEYYLLKIPGLKRFSPIDVISVGGARGIFTSTNGRCFIVNGKRFYEILEDGTKIERAQLQSYAGQVSMAENGKLLMIVDGVKGYIFRYADNNLSIITDEFFPGVQDGTLAPTDVTFLDTYFIVNIPNSNQYYWSTSYYTSDLNDTSVPYPEAPTDPATQPNGYWTPLQSGQKIGKPDNIAGLINCNNFLWLFGYNSVEVHYDTGNYNGQLFARYQGAIINIGCNHPETIAVYANNVFWLGSDKDGTLGIFSNDGMSPVRISTRGIEQMIETFDSTGAEAYTYAQSGHAFYVLYFPSAKKTLVYDTVTQSWHERTKLLDSSGQITRWDGLYATNAFGRIIIGDVSTGCVYELDPFYYLNDNPLDTGYNYIRCVKTTPISFDMGKNVRYNWVQVICNQGSGATINNQIGNAVDPSIQLAWSNDTGLTWSNERAAPIGKQGEYAKRSRVLSCGMGRNRVWRIVMTDNVPYILVSVLINGSTCRF